MKCRNCGHELEMETRNGVLKIWHKSNIRIQDDSFDTIEMNIVCNEDKPVSPITHAELLRRGLKTRCECVKPCPGMYDL